ncbi:membrane-spanning 4-domains subfamily A member 4A-like [Leptodactylus fuscus]|uniref:membrane-spanning 4-domains subfamily A member 4A-like n=1 Tax=Leptodactylus fuscus TaxID=238119 RepID=UPI003F4F10E3
MSSSANTGGVVILQHVTPQNNQPMEPQEQQSKHVPDIMPKPLVKFFQGEPEVLGVTQLFLGINHIFFGIILTISCHRGSCFVADILVFTGVLFWSGLAFIVSGSLSVAASCKPSLGKVNASLVLNIITCAAATTSVIIFSIFFAHMPRIHYYYYRNEAHCVYYKESQTCEGKFNPLIIIESIGSILFILNVLALCIALSTSIFGCKTVCRTSYNDMTVVIYQTTSVNDAKPTLSSDGEVKTQ